MSNGRKVFLYGCGVVAPESPNLKAFLKLMRNPHCCLKPYEPLQNAFLVGHPELSLEPYKEWIVTHLGQSRYHQLTEKARTCVQVGLVSTLDALRVHESSNLWNALKTLDPRVLISIGNAFGDVGVAFESTRRFEKSKAIWNRFWANPIRNAPLKMHLEDSAPASGQPPHPNQYDEDSPQRWEALKVWWEYWAPKSDQFQEFMEKLNSIESQGVGPDVGKDKISLLRFKQRARKKLNDEFKCPPPPWEEIGANLLWNIPNAPAAQISMLLGIHGPAYATYGACATFGLNLKQATDAIAHGHMDAAIIGGADDVPHPEVVGGFFCTKVLAAGKEPGIPLTKLRGTHVSGGGCIWIVAAEEAMKPLGIKPLGGLEVLGVGASSDAEHIITPSLEGPKLAIRQSLEQAAIKSHSLHSWDLHATGTPGDWSELELSKPFLSDECIISARKGIFGHGMGVAGGWELTAQALAPTLNDGLWVLPQTGIQPNDLHPSISPYANQLLLDKPRSIKTNGPLYCGKLSMGIGGITSCVITAVHGPHINIQ